MVQLEGLIKSEPSPKSTRSIYANLKAKSFKRESLFCNCFRQILPALESTSYKYSIPVVMLELGHHCVGFAAVTKLDIK